MKLTRQEKQEIKKRLEDEHLGRLCLVRPVSGDWVEGHVRRADAVDGGRLTVQTVDGRVLRRCVDSQDLRLLDRKVETKKREQKPKPEEKKKPKVERTLRADIIITEDNLLDYINEAETYIGRELIYQGKPKGRVCEIATNRSAESPAVYLRVRTPQNRMLTIDMCFGGIEIAPADERTEALVKRHLAKGDEPKRLIAGRKLYRLIERKNIWTEKKEIAERELAEAEEELRRINEEVEQTRKEMLSAM